MAEKKASFEGFGKYTHEFSDIFVWEGREYRTLDFDFTKLTGADSLAVENELSATGRAAAFPEFSGEYLVRIAARACAVPIGADMIRAMPLKDYNAITRRTRNFILA